MNRETRRITNAEPPTTPSPTDGTKVAHSTATAARRPLLIGTEVRISDRTRPAVFAGRSGTIVSVNRSAGLATEYGVDLGTTVWFLRGDFA